MYVEDFRRLMTAVGWPDFRYVSVSGISLNDANIRRKIGFATFTSRTVRAFKLSDLEDICEDYGQVAYYNGRIPGHPHYFDLDDHHRFFTGRPMLVCGNTSSMLSNTRFAKAFKVTDRIAHFGAFAGCGSDSGGPAAAESAQSKSSCAPGCC